MPCMIDGCVGRDRTAVVRDEQRAAFLGQVLESLPLDAEPVRVDRVVDAARQRADLLAAAPTVDVGVAALFGFALAGERHEIAARSDLDVGQIDVRMGRGRHFDGVVASVGHAAKTTERCCRSPATRLCDTGPTCRRDGRT